MSSAARSGKSQGEASPPCSTHPIDSNVLHPQLIRRGETPRPPSVILSASEGSHDGQRDPSLALRMTSGGSPFLPRSGQFLWDSTTHTLESMSHHLHPYAIMNPILNANTCQRMHQHAAYIHQDQLRMIAHDQHSIQPRIAWER